MNFFREAGYYSAIVYDNFGSLFGRIDLANLSDFKHSIFYQLTGDFFYFDILVMIEKDYKAFFKLEQSFFIEAIQVPELKTVAESTLQM